MENEMRKELKKRETGFFYLSFDYMIMPSLAFDDKVIQGYIFRL